MGKNGRIVVFISVLVLLLISSACTSSPLVDTKSAEATQAAVMQTAVALLKETQALEASATLPAPTPTPSPEPPAPTPSPTALPTATEIPTESIPCNQASFVKDVTIPDGQEMKPGESFLKTWRITNAGSCTWTSAYQLVFSNGERMSAPASVNLSGNIPPGSSFDLSVQLLSPAADGAYTAFFLLKAPDGTVFGMGKNNNALSAVIKVKSEAVQAPTKPTRSPLPTPKPDLPDKACEVHYNWVENMSSDGRFDLSANLINRGSRTWEANFVLSPVAGRDYMEDTFYAVPGPIKTGEEFFFTAEGYDPDQGNLDFSIVWELMNPDKNWEVYCTFTTDYTR